MDKIQLREFDLMSAEELSACAHLKMTSHATSLGISSNNSEGILLISEINKKRKRQLPHQSYTML